MNKNNNLTFWMILLGALAASMSVADILQRWSCLVMGARVGDALILASGVLLLASGAWRGLSRTAPRTASWLGAASAAIFSVTMVAGVLSGAIPCSAVG
jgi:hypothetical protein